MANSLLQLCLVYLGVCITAVFSDLYCPNPWIQAGTKCFYITTNTNRAKYAQAVGACQDMNANIATFTEQEFTELKGQIGTADHWIGLTCSADCSQKSNWEWIDGTAAGAWVEANWIFGEPDLGETSARVTDSKKWAGLYESFDTGYICKKDMEEKTPTEKSTPSTTEKPTPSTEKPTPTPTTRTSTNKPSTTTSPPELVETPVPPLTQPSTLPPAKSSTTTSKRPLTTRRPRPPVPTTSAMAEGTNRTKTGMELRPKKDDNHMGIWIGMAVLAVLGVVALGIGIYLYSKSRLAKVDKAPPGHAANRYEVRTPPMSPPPAYEAYVEPTAPIVLSAAPMGTAMYNSNGADVIKVHP